MSEAVILTSLMMMTSIDYEKSLARDRQTDKHTGIQTHTHTHARTHTHTDGLIYVNLLQGRQPNFKLLLPREFYVTNV